MASESHRNRASGTGPNLDLSGDERLKELLSFHGCEQLCRAASVQTIERRMGRIFTSNAGSASTWSMSVPSNSINTFLSHTWLTNRYLKWLALLYHFNLRGPGCFAVLYSILVGFLSYLQFLPHTSEVMYNTEIDGLASPTPSVGWIARVTITPVFLLSVVVWWDVVAAVNKILAVITFGKNPFVLPVPSIFLDKVCIHQGDRNLMQEGIRKLAAFVGVSDEMLVILSDTYLTRLWTIYEIGVSLALHRTDKVCVLPPAAPLVFFGAIVLSYASEALVWFLVSLSKDIWGAEHVSMTCKGVGYFVTACLTRSVAKQRKSLESDLQFFSIRNCNCAKESDRALVYNNIVQLLVAAGLVRPDSPRESMITAFDVFVRDSVPAAIKTNLGAFICPYWTIALLFYFRAAPELADYAVALGTGSLSPKFFFFMAIMILNWSFAMFPLGFAFMECLASKFMNLGRFPSALYVFACSTVTLVLMSARIRIDRYQFRVACSADFPAGLLIMVATSVTDSTVAYLIYNQAFSGLAGERKRFNHAIN